MRVRGRLIFPRFGGHAGLAGHALLGLLGRPIPKGGVHAMPVIVAFDVSEQRRPGFCLCSTRMDRGRFVWPVTATGTVALTSAQVSMLLEGIDWRRPERTWAPTLAG